MDIQAKETKKRGRVAGAAMLFLGRVIKKEKA